MMTDGFAYTVFVVAFIGGLAAFAVAMIVVAVVLFRRNRTAR